MKSGMEMESENQPELDRNDAGLDRGRRTDEELPPPLRADGPRVDLRNECLHLDEDDDGSRNRQWSRGVKDDADGAMVSISIDRVNVGHLYEGEQGKQRHAHHDIGHGPFASGASHPCVKCGQTWASSQNSLDQGYTYFDARSPEMSPLSFDVGNRRQPAESVSV